MAHPLNLEEVAVDFHPATGGLEVRTRVVVHARTGAEMEALVACSAAALAVYDMVKSVEKGVVITDLLLERKTGGKSGTYERRE
jgi:cyclic pyranopterin phosphate synthase